MKKALFWFLALIACWRTYAQELDVWDYWEGMDSVVIDHAIYEYELYDIDSDDVDYAADIRLV